MYEFIFLHSDALPVLLYLISFGSVTLLPAASLPVQILTACCFGSTGIVLLTIQRHRYIEYAGLIMLVLMLFCLSEVIAEREVPVSAAGRLLSIGTECRVVGTAAMDSSSGTGGCGELVRIDAELLSVNNESQITQTVHFPCILQTGSTEIIGRGEYVAFTGRVVCLYPVALQGDIETDLSGVKRRLPTLKSIRKAMQTGMLARLRGLPEDAAALLTALLAGRRDDLDDPDLLLFRISGCAHMLALSGMHLHILAMLLNTVLLRTISRKLVPYISVVLLGVYIAVVGVRPSLLRSYLFVIGTALFSPAKMPGGNICLLTLVMLMQALFTEGEKSLSFVLSFAAVFGILVLSARFAGILPGIIPGCIRSPLAVAAAAFSTTLPFTMHNFGVIYPQGILCSLLVTPVITLLMITGFLALLPGLHALNILHRVLEMLSDAVIAILRVAAAVPGMPVNDCPGEIAGIMLLLVLTGMYAREYALAKGKYRNDTLRFTRRAAGISCRAGAGNEQEIRSEFSRLSRSQATHN